MKTLIAAAACILMAASVNAADIDTDTLALIGADDMSVVSDADGIAIRGQGSRKGGGKKHGGKRGGGKHSTPVIYQKETTTYVNFAYSHQKVHYSSESKAVSFTYLKSEKVTYIRGLGI